MRHRRENGPYCEIDETEDKLVKVLEHKLDDDCILIPLKPFVEYLRKTEHLIYNDKDRAFVFTGIIVTTLPFNIWNKWATREERKEGDLLNIEWGEGHLEQFDSEENLLGAVGPLPNTGQQKIQGASQTGLGETEGNDTDYPPVFGTETYTTSGLTYYPTSIQKTPDRRRTTYASACEELRETSILESQHKLAQNYETLRKIQDKANRIYKGVENTFNPRQIYFEDQVEQAATAMAPNDEYSGENRPAVLMGGRKLPVFREHEESFKEFFQQFEAYCRYYQLEEKDILVQFKEAFKGKAKKLLNSLQHKSPKATYQQVSQELKTYYYYPVKMSKARKTAKLQNL